jgi:hypothetical protein
MAEIAIDRRLVDAARDALKNPVRKKETSDVEALLRRVADFAEPLHDAICPKCENARFTNQISADGALVSVRCTNCHEVQQAPRKRGEVRGDPPKSCGHCNSGSIEPELRRTSWGSWEFVRFRCISCGTHVEV